MQMIPDYHVHTPLCNHAEGDAREYRRAVRKMGMTEMCFTDHIPDPGGYDPDHRMNIAEFPTYRSTVAALQDGESPTVLFGIEADYYKGCEGFLDRWLPLQGFDYVLGSVHYIEEWGFDNPDQRHVWDSVDVKAVWKQYFRLVAGLVKSGLFDAVGHLDLPKKFGNRPHDKDLKEMARPALDMVAEAGMGIELNTSGLRRPVKEPYPSMLLMSMACQRGIPICFGSDAHNPDEVGAGFDRALEWAREAGYTHYFRIRGRTKGMVPLPHEP